MAEIVVVRGGGASRASGCWLRESWRWLRESWLSMVWWWMLQCGGSEMMRRMAVETDLE